MYAGRLTDSRSMFVPRSTSRRSRIRRSTITPAFRSHGVLGADFIAVRVVSVIATGATLLFIWLTVRRDTGSLAGVVATGVFAGCYALSDGWLDLGRVDALFLALLTATWFVASGAKTVRHWSVAALLASLAFFTKQPALMVVLPLGLYLLFTNRRHAIVFAAVAAAVSVAMFLLMNGTTSGWYAYYAFRIPRLRLAISSGTERLFTFWTVDLLPLTIALLAGAYAVVSEKKWRHAALAVGCIGSAWGARLEGGAWNNAVLPAYLAASITFGLWLRPERQVRVAFVGLATVQMLVLLYDPRRYVPGAADLAAGAAIVRELRALPRPVFVVDHNSWSSAAGLREYAHGWAMTDILWVDPSSTGQALQDEVSDALAAGTFGSIITDAEPSWFQEEIEASYAKRGALISSHEYRMRSGATRVPSVLFVPKRK